MARDPDRVVALDDITKLAQAVNDLQDRLAEAVYDCRERWPDVTWQQIGEAVGTSRQAAWERFTHAALKTGT